MGNASRGGPRRRCTELGGRTIGEPGREGRNTKRRGEGFACSRRRARVSRRRKSCIADRAADHGRRPDGRSARVVQGPAAKGCGAAEDGPTMKRAGTTTECADNDDKDLCSRFREGLSQREDMGRRRYAWARSDFPPERRQLVAVRVWTGVAMDSGTQVDTNLETMRPSGWLQTGMKTQVPRPPDTATRKEQMRAGSTSTPGAASAVFFSFPEWDRSSSVTPGDHGWEPGRSRFLPTAPTR